MKSKGILPGSMLLVLMLVAPLLVSACAAPASTPASQKPTSQAPASLSPAPASTVIKWRGQNYWNLGPTIGPVPGTGSGLHGFRWAEWLKQATNGRLVIELADPGAIVPNAEIFSAVSKGAIPVGVTFSGSHMGVVPEAEVYSQPIAAFDGVDEAWVMLQRYGLRDRIKKINAKYNVWSESYPNAKYAILGANFQISSIDALKGKKLRAVGAVSRFLSLLGATPVNLSWDETYMALKLGTVDGYFAGISALEAQKLKEVTKYILIKPLFSVSLGDIIINMDAFNKLPSDIRDLIAGQTKNIALEAQMDVMASEEYIARNAQPQVQLVSWSEADAAQFRKTAVEKLYPELAAKNPGNKELIDLFTQFLKEYKKL